MVGTRKDRQAKFKQRPSRAAGSNSDKQKEVRIRL
jgi:hypothetical protein